MEADGRVRIALACEDAVHHTLATTLVDRVLSQIAHLRGADWFQIDDARTWTCLDGVKGAPHYYDLHQKTEVLGPGGRPLRVHGHIDGQPVSPGAKKLREVYLLHHFAPQMRAPSLLVILQDTDGDSRLVQGAEQVRAFVRAQTTPTLLVIGLPHRDAEAWLFAAPLPMGDKMTHRHKLAASVLSFDPFQEPERLTNGPNDAETDAKRVVRFLLLGEGERLGKGHPDSRPPNAEADELAQRVAADLTRALTYRACGLATFIEDLMAALPIAFRSHLPPGPPPP